MHPNIEIINHPDSIVEIKLNRPEKKNAMSFDMIFELISTGKKIAKQKSTRVVLLTGSDECFSAGIDLNDLRDKKNRFKVACEFMKPGINRFQKVNLVWREMPIPIIAVIEGYCFGAGMQLALGADFRIAKTDAQLSIMEAKWGLIPDMAATVTLRGLVGLDKAKELAMTARVISGREALQIGLVSHIAENPMNKAMELAQEIINRSPDAVAGIKHIFNSMQTDSASKSLALEKKWQRKLILGENTKLASKKEKDSTLNFLPRLD
jgi:enoyl-CoA hydratase/carnithine racemase